MRRDDGRPPRLEPSADAWSLVETRFEPELFGKCESLMCSGNGYLGLRAAHEEDYAGQRRGLYFAGSFGRAMEGESVELPNCPDPAAMEARLDGERLDLLRLAPLEYRRALDLRSGELARDALVRTAAGRTWRLRHARFASLADPRLIAFRFEARPLDGRGSVELRFGIDGRVANAGVQHFAEGEQRVLGRSILRYAARAPGSGFELELSLVSGLAGASERAAERPGHPRFEVDRRRIVREDSFAIERGGVLVFERFVLVRASSGALDATEPVALPDPGDYGRLLAESRNAWSDFRESAPDLDTDALDDQLALRVALYHLRAMTPDDGGSSSIGAKGLTGEGYRGHVFWDAEMFMLPFLQYGRPELARGILEYRVRRLDAARRRAAARGYEGAMFPWESAATGDEETPERAGLDPHTGNLAPVWSGLKEHHVTADLAWAVAKFREATDDDAFMDSGGAALVFEAARFWRSRAAEGPDGALHINDVVGPDEYSEHVDDNAYTNYLAKACVDAALELARAGHPAAPAEAELERLRDFSARIHLPEPRGDGVLPQDAGFLSLPELDVSAYRAAERKQAILREHSREDLNGLQVLKQADAVMLLFLMPERFTREVALATYRYYEPRTVHDSSLSPAIHAAVAARLGETDEAYRRFIEAREVDLGPRPHSSDDGVHAAGFGALWMALVMGFGGFRVADGVPRFEPRLPTAWRGFAFPLRFRGRRLRVEARGGGARIELLEGDPIEVELYGRRARLARGEAIDGKR
ncbi:MAG: glycoside hydrolase family 65 protein [Spirochaetales bacterium]|nr:glycoside hydrolase family 65 protein [Spirochaetales bacterium]